MIDELSREAEKIGISPTLFDKIIHQWSSPWRFYHHLEHLFSLYKFINQYSATDNYNPLLLAALYHDVVYNPLSNTNEEDSAEQFLIDCAFLEDEVKSTVNQLILDTKNQQATTEISDIFLRADLQIINESFEKLIIWENKIFKEYQFYDTKLYIKGRIDVLNSLLRSKYLNESNKTNLIHLMDYVAHRKYNIGLFAGSFNPFHKGHYDVLKKAENIFDKVIIATAVNLEKDGSSMIKPLSQLFPFHQTIHIDGLLTNFIKQNEIDNIHITLVKGLRNGNDLSYEVNQLRYMEELYPKIKNVYLFCDRDYEHISSSGIKSLLNIGTDEAIELANKYLYHG